MEVIKFGQYPQKDNEVLPLEWYVVSDWAGKALLISKPAIDLRPFHSTYGSLILWETSDLRKWLNLDFYLQAFSAEERKRIVPTPLSRDYYFDKHWGQRAKEVRDKIFLFNVHEIETFLPMSIRKCTPTDFARNKNRYLNPSSECKDCEWWIRNSGLRSDDVALCLNDGTINMQGVANGWSCYVRPAIRIIPPFKLKTCQPPLELDLFTGGWQDAQEGGSDREWNQNPFRWWDDEE